MKLKLFHITLKFRERSEKATKICILSTNHNNLYHDVMHIYINIALKKCWYYLGTCAWESTQQSSSCPSITFTVILAWFTEHPNTHIFEYFQDKRRVVRRRSNTWSYSSALETQNELYGVNTNALLTKEEAAELYSQLGIKYQWLIVRASNQIFL